MASLVLCLIMLLVLLFSLSRPVLPSTETWHHIDDDVMVSLTDNVPSKNASGAFRGHMWPVEIPENRDSRIYLSVDMPRLDILRVCTHEFLHHELDEQGRSVFAHHALMERRGMGNIYQLSVFEIDDRCWSLLPHII